MLMVAVNPTPISTSDQISPAEAQAEIMMTTITIIRTRKRT